MSVGVWIIPARAGFTLDQGVALLQIGDHPRSRGVYPSLDLIGQFTSGSSPLARGLPMRRTPYVAKQRIIPARAGFTVAVVCDGVGVRDHPRSRGVYWLGAFVICILFGIIPARAGFTPSSAPSTPREQDHPRSRGVYACGSLESQRRATLPDLVCLHCRPSARSAEFR